MPLKLITPPAEEPVDVETLKQRSQFDVDLATRDDELTSLIIVARQYIELLCRRALVTQTWELILERFANADPLSQPPRDAFVPPVPFFPIGYDYLSAPWRHLREKPWIELPFGALASVSTVTYLDQTGTPQTLALTTDYVIDDATVPGRIYPAYGTAWPVPRRQWDAVRVQYIVGTDADDVPAGLQQALILLVRQMFASSQAPAAAANAVGMAFDALVAPYKIMRV